MFLTYIQNYHTMKTKLLLLGILCLSLSTKAQLNFNDPDFSWRGLGNLEKPIDTVIKSQNYLIAMSDRDIRHSLYSVRILPNSELLLTYRSSIQEHESLDMYFFDRYGKCYLYRTVQELKNLSDQLQNMSTDFIKFNTNTLYHKRLNLKMVYTIDLEYNVVVFNYARKQTQIPKIK